MTIKEIAQKYGIDYYIVYIALSEARIVRYGKNNQYDEMAALGAIMKYLTSRINRYKAKICNYLDCVGKISAYLKNECQKQG